MTEGLVHGSLHAKDRRNSDAIQNVAVMGPAETNPNGTLASWQAEGPEEEPPVTMRGLRTGQHLSAPPEAE